MDPSLQCDCKSCGEIRKLVKAHIVPESFCRQFVREGKPAKIVAPNEYAKRSHTGIYDTTILCEECERIFSQVDDYAQELLLHSEAKIDKIKYDTEDVALRINEYNHALLHKFLLSVLWRASVSSNPFFDQVDLGPYAPRIKKLALGLECAEQCEYPFVAGRLVHPLPGLMLAPFRERVSGVNYWRIYIGDWHFWLKVDIGRSTPVIFKDIEARSGAPLYAICRNLLGSQEHQAAKFTAALRKRSKWEQND